MSALATIKMLVLLCLGGGVWLAWDGRPVQADVLTADTSTGSAGIDALRLHSPPYNLTGRKIALGQVEIGRPGQYGLDKAASRYGLPQIRQVFFRNNPAKSNSNVDPHAHSVASLMVGNTKLFRGIAPGARLYSTAIGIIRRNGQPEECLASQHIAMQNGGDVRAINFSFGESLQQDPRPNAVLDGNALLTQCIDWSTRVHNVLYVVAGNQGKGGIPIPTDNFNGVNVAFSNRQNGVFTQVAPANLGGDVAEDGQVIPGLEANVGSRRSISLVAPGDDVAVLNLTGRMGIVSGTSFAAPHVTATIALLQEYGDRLLAQAWRNGRARQEDVSSRSRPSGAARSTPRWSLDARRAEVMKAVLLNSADKLKDSGNGLRLAMSRTILDKLGGNWFAGDAYRNPKIPLHLQMGTGQLNAFRAYQQFKPGQWSPVAPVAAIGWDYRSVGRLGATVPNNQDYLIDKPLQQGSFIAITLAWNRWVELEDSNQNRQYDLGEGFRDRGLNNLNLYLMRANETNINNALWSSSSDVDSVEHIFYQIPVSGRYKIRVHYQQQVNEPTQPYALAWWSVPVPGK